ncbi:hypothetical protein D3OALGB2SA_2691 [Olavius algarvensis associated proteobacterium Delta 3]|nr:hypothetical protein D3OALGB2SA_2691 [Olavius algarvensis associated proteobacterium Delta 3]
MIFLFEPCLPSIGKWASISDFALIEKFNDLIGVRVQLK